MQEGAGGVELLVGRHRHDHRGDPGHEGKDLEVALTPSAFLQVGLEQEGHVAVLVLRACPGVEHGGKPGPDPLFPQPFTERHHALSELCVSSHHPGVEEALSHPEVGLGRLARL